MVEQGGSRQALAELAEFEALLTGERHPLARTIAAILAQPDRVLRSELVRVPLHQMQEPDPDRLLELMNDPQATRRAEGDAPHFVTTGGGFCFTESWERRVRVRYDTPANLELSRLLELLARQLRRLQAGAAERVEGGGFDAPALERLRRLRRQVDRWQRALVELGGTGRGGAARTGGTVLEQEPRYRAVRRAHREYRLAQLGRGGPVSE